MKSVIAFALAVCASALPAAEIKARQIANVTIYFTGLAISPGSDIHYAAVAANDFKFWINKETATYTPSGSQFPKDANLTTSTVFSKFLPFDTLSLLASVPGGQAVYVAADGALSYTQAHSANTFGGLQTGFDIAQSKLLFEEKNFIAVPTNETTDLPCGRGIAYQIYAANRTNLTGEEFTFRAVPASNFTINHPAWEYD